MPEWLRLTPGLLLAVFGLGVFLTEYMHLLISIRPLPERALAMFERLSRGELPIVIFAVLIMPVVEEFIFRGLLLRALLALQRPLFAVPLGAAIFAALHLNLWQLLPAFCMGLLFGWVYARTRSLVACIVGHMAWNAQGWIATDVLGLSVRGYGLEHDPGRFPQQPVWWLTIGIIALFAGLYFLRKQLEVSPSLRNDMDG